jgi:hypothetical protein
MTKIERRRATVTLHHGNYEAELAELLDKTMAAQRKEETTPGRFSEKSAAIALAKQHDDLLAEAEASAIKITVWAIRHDEWSVIADEHPPREDDAEDAKRGLNMKTFPKALLLASLAEPKDYADPVGQQAEGQRILDDLAPSRVHYAKLESAAWNVNVGDDALPKFSLVSLLKQQRDPDSGQQPDSE